MIKLGVKDFNDLFGGLMFDSILKEKGLGTPVDYADEDAKNYYITIQAAGYKKDDIKVTVEGRCVKVLGKSSHDRMRGSLDYYFTAPKPIETIGIDADLKDGVLTVMIPKQEKEQPIQIEIK
jgi:HSP20 family molecular chaperone IbpA